MRTLLILCLLTAPLNATIWTVDYVDNDGPSWTGIIDSETDTLTINTYSIAPGDFYVISAVTGQHPSELVTKAGQVWPASMATPMPPSPPNQMFDWMEITPYDIPDDWSGDMLTDPIFFYGGLQSCAFCYGGWGDAWMEDQGIRRIFGGGNFGPLAYSYLVSRPPGAGMSQPDSLTISVVNEQPAAGPGDANMDGIFNIADLIQVFQAGKYHRDVFADWSEGDWTGDERFTSSDMMEAFQKNTFERGPATVAAVPEPSSLVALVFSALGILSLRRTPQ